MDTSTKNISYRKDNILLLENRDFSVKRGKEVNPLPSVISEKFHNLTVISDVSIAISSGNVTSTEITVNGKMPFNGVVQLTASIDKDSDTLTLRVNLLKGGKDRCSCNDLSVNVLLPHKALASAYLSSDCGDIYVDNSIMVLGTLQMYTQIGFLECFASCAKVEASSTKGSFDLDISARKSIEVTFDTDSGNFLGLLNNFGHIEFFTTRTTGVVRNRHQNRVGPTAILRIFSKTGDVKIR